MPGAGTDKTKRWIETPAPIVVLVEPQLGENIGAAARAMANFGLSRLRLVKPQQGWPNERARVHGSGRGPRSGRRRRSTKASRRDRRLQFRPCDHGARITIRPSR